MKRTELIKKISALGAILERHGGKHDWYVKKETNVGQAGITKLEKPLPVQSLKLF